MFKIFKVINVFGLAKKAVKYAAMGGLIVDTVKFFHDTGVERGIFKDEDLTVTK